MNYDFAICRVATFVRPDFCRSSAAQTFAGDALYEKFVEQAKKIANHPRFIKANDRAMAIARGMDLRAERKKCTRPDSPDGIGELAVFDLAGEYPEAVHPAANRDTLVARMPSERIAVRVGDANWILRTRAHITSCALQGNTRPTKLWWTFEGIPADNDPDRRPSDDAVSALLSLTAQIEQAVRGGLVAAFTDSLKSVTDPKLKVTRWPERLSITLAECPDDAVDALLDAMYFDSRAPSEIMKSHDKELKEARDGMKSFENFIRNVVGERARVDDKSVSVVDELPKVKGILWHRTHPRSQLVAGVARRAGAKIGLDFLSAAERRRQLSEERVRLRSAARPLSAYLADSEAVALERRAAHLHMT